MQDRNTNQNYIFDLDKELIKTYHQIALNLIMEEIFIAKNQNTAKDLNVSSESAIKYLIMGIKDIRQLQQIQQTTSKTLPTKEQQQHRD